MAMPVGVGAAIALEEYAGRSRWARLVEINIANLAAVPSIIYGLLGLGLFVHALQLERTLLAGAATLALLMLPVVILTAREALRAVPLAQREAALALGSTKWQTIWHHVLPAALPGLLTGLILAVSRVIGETAPLIVIGALTYVPFVPDGPSSPFTALPIQIFAWISRPGTSFRANAAAAILAAAGGPPPDQRPGDRVARPRLTAAGGVMGPHTSSHRFAGDASDVAGPAKIELRALSVFYGETRGPARLSPCRSGRIR